MVKSEAGGHFTRHTSLGLSGSRAATSGERGALGSDVSRLWCSIHQHVTSRHARVCHRAGTQTNQHKPLGHVTSRSLKRMSVRHRVESGAPFNTGRDLREDIVIERGGLRDASASDFRNNSILIDVTYADPQALTTQASPQRQTRQSPPVCSRKCKHRGLACKYERQAFLPFPSGVV